MSVIIVLYLYLIGAVAWNVGTSWRNRQSFAALKEDGSVVIWGVNSGSSSAKFKSVYSTLHAWAGLREDGTVETWGDKGMGGLGAGSVKDVDTIYSTEGAFAALIRDGTMFAWGDNRYGGLIPSDISSQLVDVKRVFTNPRVFCALRGDSSVVCWGSISYGGQPGGVDTTNIKCIYTTTESIAAVTHGGAVVDWGQSSNGGSTSGVIGLDSNVVSIASTSGAFAALKSDGSIVIWGNPGLGGFNSLNSDRLVNVRDVVNIYSTRMAFCAVRRMSGNNIVCWGRADFGGGGDPNAMEIRSIYASERAFASISSTGKVRAWGSPAYGGSMTTSAVDALNGAVAVTICTTNTAMAALTTAGRVVAWGDVPSGGSVAGFSSLNSGVISLASTFGSMVALKDDGSMVGWGDASKGGATPKGLRNVNVVYGDQILRAQSLFPHTYRLVNDGEFDNSLIPYPSSQPTSQPSTPTSVPTSAPTTNRPTSQPSGQPTSAPTAVPTAVPTTAPTIDLSTIVQFQHGATLNFTALKNGEGFHYSAVHRLTNLGHYERQYYLSIFMHDTGFGPVKAGQYLSFYIGDTRRTLTQVVNGTNERIQCAPLSFSAYGVGCSKRFVPCVYNLELLPEDISNLKGGSLLLQVVSHGVVSSACPHAPTGSVVYVKYELTADKAQNTPSPTMRPTPAPTKDETTIVNGLELNINKLDVWKLLQIAVGVGVACAFGGIYLCKLREKGGASVYQHPMPFAAVSLGMLGMELSSMVFLINNLFQYGYGGSGGVLIAFRLLEMIVGGLLLLAVFGKLTRIVDLRPYLASDHFIAESRVYFTVAAFCLVDLTFIVFLPWKTSQFAELSKGFPSIGVFRAVQTSLIATAFVSFVIQVSYLAGKGNKNKDGSFDANRDLMFVFNIILLGIKVVLIVLESLYKSAKLSQATTSIDSAGAGAGAGAGTAGLTSSPPITGLELSDVVRYTENPLNINRSRSRHREGGAEDVDDDNVVYKDTDSLLLSHIRSMEAVLDEQGKNMVEQNKRIENLAALVRQQNSI